ncbi:MAG: SMP-30/gluconolactonase/LRE family protein [Acidobacteriia bacterium]|nr:SMP-30/gluconolactonase/LRE family protein [Terriglobia bacterium]
MFIAAGLSAQDAGKIIRLDPGLDALISPDAHIEKLKDGFGFLEGPVWVHTTKPGYLLFSDIPANVIDKWTPDGKVTTFLDKSGFAGDDPGDAGYQMNNGFKTVTLYGSNGVTFDKQGRITWVQHGDRSVMRLEKGGKRTVLASKYEGKRLNSPNDLVYKSDGSLYFTDPPFGLRKLADDPKKELPYAGVFLLSKGKLQLIIKDLQAPNGIAFSPDEKYLYVNDSFGKKYMRYEVQPDGTVANGKVFMDMTASKEDGVPDGMKVDQKGNIYGAGPGGVWVMSPEGKHLGTIKPAENPANLAWGDADGKTLYFTAVTGLYRLRVNVAGIRP